MEDAPPSQPHPSYPVLSAGDERKLFARVYNPTLTKDALFCALPAKCTCTARSAQLAGSRSVTQLNPSMLTVSTLCVLCVLSSFTHLCLWRLSDPCLFLTVGFESWVLYSGFDRAAADNARARGVAPGAGGEDEDMDSAADDHEASSSRRAGGGERPGFIDCSVLLAEPPAYLDLSDAPASSSSSSSSSSAAASTGMGSLRSHWIQLRTDLQEGVDFTLLNYDAYMRLCEWYGGGPTISRKVVLVGLSQLEMVDLHPQLLVMTPLVPPAPGRVVLEQRRIKPFPKSMLLSEVIDEQKPQHLLEIARVAFEAEPEQRNAEGKVIPKLGVRERVVGRVWRLKTTPATAAAGAGAAAPAATAAAAASSSTPPAPVPNLAALAASLTPPEFKLRFECHPKLDMGSKLEFLEWSQGHEILIEYRMANQPWSRTGNGKENWTDFAVGDVVDVLDPDGKCQSTHIVAHTLASFGWMAFARFYALYSPPLLSSFASSALCP